MPPGSGTDRYLCCARATSASRRRRRALVSLYVAAAAANFNTLAEETYTDEYFAPDEVASIDAATAAATADDGPPTQYSLIYRHFVDSQERRRALVEDGFEFEWQRQTLNYGDFYIELQQLTTNGERDRDTSSQKVFLEHTDFALNETFTLNSGIGHFRNDTPQLISSGYRFYLPSTILQGGYLAAGSGATVAAFTHGGIGRYQGTATNGFRRNNGDLTGFGVEHELDQRWRIAGQWWRTNDALFNRISHNVMAFGGEYQSLERDQRHQLRTLNDSKGNDGLWYDGLTRRGRWIHRYGGFRLDPGLRWTDIPIENDRQLIYWRADFSSFRWRWTLNSEASQNDIDDDPLVSGRTQSRSFANVNWIARRDLEIGGLAALNTQHPESGLIANDVYGYTLQSHVTKRWPFLRSRLELRVNDLDIDIDKSREYQIRWDNDWYLAAIDRVTNEFEVRWDEDGSHALRISALTSKRWSEQLSTSMQAQAIHSRNTFGLDSEDYNVGFGVSWLPIRDIFVDLTATYTQTQNDSPAGLATNTRNGTVLLTIGYSTSRGSVPRQFGFDAGGLGSGRIEGIVYLDANRNGRQDPGEQAVTGITVYLDGRFSAVTDAEGRYEFEPVPTGRHELRLAVWDAPLPWGLDDDKPVEVTLPVRGQIELDFNLVEINP